MTQLDMSNVLAVPGCYFVTKDAAGVHRLNCKETFRYASNAERSEIVADLLDKELVEYGIDEHQVDSVKRKYSL